MRINMIQEVKKYLTVYHQLRDSDVDLIWSIWINQISKILNPQIKRHLYPIPQRQRDVSKISAIELMRLWKDGKISSPSNITRSRRKCQELYPETRGKCYEARRKQQRRVIGDIRSANSSERINGNDQGTVNIPDNETQKRLVYNS